MRNRVPSRVTNDVTYTTDVRATAYVTAFHGLAAGPSSVFDVPARPQPPATSPGRFWRRCPSRSGYGPSSPRAAARRARAHPSDIKCLLSPPLRRRVSHVLSHSERGADSALSWSLSNPSQVLRFDKLRRLVPPGTPHEDILAALVENAVLIQARTGRGLLSCFEFPVFHCELENRRVDTALCCALTCGVSPHPWTVAALGSPRGSPASALQGCWVSKSELVCADDAARAAARDWLLSLFHNRRDVGCERWLRRASPSLHLSLLDARLTPHAFCLCVLPFARHCRKAEIARGAAQLGLPSEDAMKDLLRDVATLRTGIADGGEAVWEARTGLERLKYCACRFAFGCYLMSFSCAVRERPLRRVVAQRS